MTLLTTSQTADLLGITRDGVHKLVQRGVLPASQFGKAYAFEPSDVARAARRARAGAGGPKKKPAR